MKTNYFLSAGRPVTHFKWTSPNALLLLIYYISYLVSFAILLVASLSKTLLAFWDGYWMQVLCCFRFLSFIIFGRGRDNPNFETGHCPAS